MLREFGQRLPLVTRASTGILEASEGRLVAGRALGWRYIAVLPCEDDALAATRFALGDNRSAALAVIDEDRLTEQLLALHEQGVEREAFQARVAAEAARLGAGREADAERLVIMRATAEQAAGFKPAPLPEDDAAPPPRKKCITRETMGTAYGTGMSEQEARRSMQQPVGKRCKLTSSTCKSDRLTPWWVECTGSYVCPPTEFPCSPVVRA